jgi:hypothetical protein
MNWTDIIVQLVRALATPAAILIALYWFRNGINKIFDAVEYFIKERRFKTTLPGVSVEVESAVGGEVQNVRKRVEAPPSPRYLFERSGPPRSPKVYRT